MNLQDFKRLEKELGHPPTEAEVREYKNRPMFKTANVQFKDTSYNYKTSVNGKLNDAEIIKYFKNQLFNLGNVHDDMHVCIECTVEASSFTPCLN